MPSCCRPFNQPARTGRNNRVDGKYDQGGSLSSTDFNPQVGRPRGHCGLISCKLLIPKWNAQQSLVPDRVSALLVVHVFEMVDQDTLLRPRRERLAFIKCGLCSCTTAATSSE